MKRCAIAFGIGFVVGSVAATLVIADAVGARLESAEEQFLRALATLAGHDDPVEQAKPDRRASGIAWLAEQRLGDKRQP